MGGQGVCQFKAVYAAEGVGDLSCSAEKVGVSNGNQACEEGSSKGLIDFHD